MVRLVKSGNLVAESGSAPAGTIPVKLEIEDPLDDEHGPLNKRSKISAPLPPVIAIFYFNLMFFGFFIL